MSNAHDYYMHPGADPDMRNKGEGKFYIEPDWFANHHDGALPIVSTIGRGPKGYGLKIDNDDAGNITITPEDPMESPVTYHLGNWDMWVTQENGEIQDGQNTKFTVHISDGTTTKTKDVIVPCGSQGSRIFFSSDDVHAKEPDNVYTVESMIMPYIPDGSIEYPEPRVGDICIVAVKLNEDDENVTPCLGAIMAVVEDPWSATVYAPTALALYEISETIEVPGDYLGLSNLPSINGITIIGDMAPEDLSITPVASGRFVPFEVHSSNSIQEGSGGGSFVWRGNGDINGSVVPLYMGDNVWMIPIPEFSYNTLSGGQYNQYKLPYIEAAPNMNPFLGLQRADFGTGYFFDLIGYSLNAYYAEDIETVSGTKTRLVGMAPVPVVSYQRIRGQSTSNVTGLQFGLSRIGTSSEDAEGVVFVVSGYILIRAREDIR